MDADNVLCTHSSVDGPLGGFCLPAIVMLLLWPWVHSLPFTSLLSVLLGENSEVELLDHMILFLIFLSVPTAF